MQAFRYSVYFDLYSYSWYYLYRQDSVLAKQFTAALPAGVRKDYAELKEFLRRHRNPVEAVIDNLYGQYLKANQQPSGKLSYNEVIAWLIAYYKKYGEGRDLELILPHHAFNRSVGLTTVFSILLSGCI